MDEVIGESGTEELVPETLSWGLSTLAPHHYNHSSGKKGLIYVEYDVEP